MQAFTQYTPTRIVFGKDTEHQAGSLAKQMGATRVFVIYGGGSVVRSGLLSAFLSRNPRYQYPDSQFRVQ